MGMAGHLLLMPGLWDFACLGSLEAGMEEQRGQGGAGGQGGSWGRSQDMALPAAPALLGESTAGTAADSSGAQKQLENSWGNAGDALGRDLP